MVFLIPNRLIYCGKDTILVAHVIHIELLLTTGRFETNEVNFVRTEVVCGFSKMRNTTFSIGLGDSDCGNTRQQRMA